MAYNDVDVIGPGSSDGAGYRIGDGYVLTAGHVVFEYNGSSSSPSVTTNQTVIEYRPYHYSYLAEISNRLAIIAGGGAADMDPESIEGSTSVFINDSVIIERSGNVDEDDQGLIVFLSGTDLRDSEALFGSGAQVRMVSDSHNRGADITLVQSNVFRATDVVVAGDSGGAFLFEAEGKGFVIGTVSGHLIGSYSVGTHFSYDEWQDINVLIGTGKSNNVTLSEPTNMIVGSASGDGAMNGSYRADIILGRDGDEIISDGDLLGDAVWANDRLFGGAGDDALSAGNGNDLVHGGDHREYNGAARIAIDSDGNDLIYYTGGRTAAEMGLEVRLVSSTSTDAAVWEFGNEIDKSRAAYIFDMLTGSNYSFGNDTLISIEQVWLSVADDVVRIDTLDANVLAGGDELGGISKIDMAGQGLAQAAGDLIDATNYTGPIKIDLDGSSFNVHAVGDTSLGLTILNAEHANGGTGNDDLHGDWKNNRLDGGAGNDKLVGRDGDDTFIGGEGDDSISGGADGADGTLADGVDTVDYSSSANPITITFNGTATSAGITVYDGSGGTDTLKSIEKVIGTTGYDVIRINGEIKSATNLTIDANGGQAPNAFGSVINGSGSTKELKIEIDSLGNGYIRSIGGGQIDLKGFHTQAIGTAFDDEISDASGGKKRLDGGAGNDIISAAGSSGSATIYGGAGDDTLTGGSGNDIIYGGLLGEPWTAAGNVLNGGAGSDLLVSHSANDTVDGGTGSDYIKVLLGSETYYGGEIDGGEGDDVIDITGYIDGVDVALTVDGGHDTVVTTPSDWVNSAMTGATVNIVMDGLSYGDFTIIVDAPSGSSFQGWTDIAVVRNDTGDSIFLPDQYIHANESGGSGVFSIIRFNNEQLNIYHNIVFGSVSAYATDLSGFNAATAPDVGDTAGTAGDDHLAGGYGDDSLSGGDGDDVFEVSGGNDIIDGGAGNDTLNFFGARSDFTVSGDVTSMTVTSMDGREGKITVTGVERIFLVSDGQTYTVADFLPYRGTLGDDVIAGTDQTDEIHGLAGNDTLNGMDGDDVITGGAGDDQIDGGAGRDIVTYSGSSSDYIVTRLSGGGITVESTGLGIDDGIDVLQDVETIYFAGDKVLFDPSELPLFGTSGADILVGGQGDDDIQGEDGDDVLEGLGGNDVLNGGGGADSMAGGAGDDLYIVDDIDDTLTENVGEGYDSVESSVSHTLGANLEDLTLWSDVATNGTGNALDNGLFGDDFDNVLSGLDGDDFLQGAGGSDTLNGGDGLDAAAYWGPSSDYELFRNVDGSVTVRDLLSGEEDTLIDIEELYFSDESAPINVADLPLRGTSSSDILIGNSGNDQIYGFGGDDRLIGGAGNDALDGGLGQDAAVFSGLQADYTIATNAGLVTISDDQPSTDGDDGIDAVVGIEKAEFKGGVQVGITSPIVLDLNGDGVSLINNRDTNIAFDWDGDGRRNQTGWVDSGDGFLMFDRDGNGLVSNGGELSFTSDKPGAKSDLDGLRTFDSNGDGYFSTRDEKFGSFQVWCDANGNGRSEVGEISTLGAAGIASINLAGEAVNQSWVWGDNITINNGSYTRTDGSTAAFGDIALNYEVSHQRDAAPFLSYDRMPPRRGIMGGGPSGKLQMDWQYARDPIAQWPQRGDQKMWSGPAVLAVDDRDQFAGLPISAATSVFSVDRQLAMIVQEMSAFGAKSAGEGLGPWQREYVRAFEFFA